jgi:hypothetical protein
LPSCREKEERDIERGRERESRREINIQTTNEEKRMCVIKMERQRKKYKPERKKIENIE